MAVVNAAQAAVKTVADPNALYESMKSVWERNRAVCSGERYVKDYDSLIDRISFRNLLIPFSPSMTDDQYEFYKAEAELPGITVEFAKMLIGGLLRKQPILELPEKVQNAEEIKDWIINEFGRDDSSLTSFMDDALWEEIQTSRAWIFVDYPKIEKPDSLTQEEIMAHKPYPILVEAEAVINWRVKTDNLGKTILSSIIVKGTEETFEKNEFHPEYTDTVWVHDLNDAGRYRIRKYQRVDKTLSVPVVAGEKPVDNSASKLRYELVETNENILSNGEPLTFIPAWPLNGNVDINQPILSAIIDKEVALYNKISRRNHLLYGAATYTPIIFSDMSPEEFQQTVSGGLGTWINLNKGDDAKVLDTPTDALADMDRAIAASIEEMAKLGIRMLTPETEQSGVALEIRNAAQTAKLGSLNNKVSNTMRQIITFMINWRYDLDLEVADVRFSLSTDFNPVPLGADWLRLATEWYKEGLIPRSAWLVILKHNDMLAPDYDDEEGIKEINGDELIVSKDDENYLNKMK